MVLHARSVAPVVNSAARDHRIERLTTIAVTLHRALPCEAVVWATIERTSALVEMIVWPADEDTGPRVRRAAAPRLVPLLTRPGVARPVDRAGAGPLMVRTPADLADAPLDATHLLSLPVGDLPVRGWLVAREAHSFSRREIAIGDVLVRGIRRLTPPSEQRRPPGGPATSEPVALTVREREMLRLISQGLTAAAIGRRTGISPRTVQKHLQNAYAKLGCGDRLGAVERIRSLGWLRAEEGLAGNA